MSRWRERNTNTGTEGLTQLVMCCTCIIYIISYILLATLLFPECMVTPFHFLLACSHVYQVPTTAQYPLFLLYTRIYAYVYAIAIIQYIIGSRERLAAYCHFGDPDVPRRLVRSAPAEARPVTARCLTSLPSSHPRSTLHRLSPPR